MNLDAKYVRVDFHGTMMNKSKKKRRVKKMESKWKMSTEIFPVKKNNNYNNKFPMSIQNQYIKKPNDLCFIFYFIITISPIHLFPLDIKTLRIEKQRKKMVN